MKPKTNSAKANKELKDYMFKHGVSQFDLAKKFDVSETTVFRRMRTELTPDEKELYMSKVKEIISERGD